MNNYYHFQSTSRKFVVRLSNTIIGTLLLISLIGCEKTVFEIKATDILSNDTGNSTDMPEEPGLDETIFPQSIDIKQSISNQPQFDFELIVVNCTVNGRSVYAIMENKTLYTFLWFVDDNYAGNNYKVECVKGVKILVTATRISDGVSSSKTLFYKPQNSSFGE